MTRERAAILIKGGETDECEFKSHFRYDIREEKTGKHIIKSAVTAICGFLNRVAGGTVLIGVADDGEILGIEPDRFKNQDVAQRALSENLHNLSDGYDPNSICVTFVEQKGKKIMAVHCVMNPRPVFLVDGVETFPVRNGPQVTSLAGRDLYSYISKHWPDYQA